MRELESPESLRWNARESYASIAKKLEVDEETVRKRVQRVQQSGILQGWELIVNPHLIGRESASVELEVKDDSTKNTAVAQIRLVEGVVSILNFNGRQLQVGFYYRNEKALARQLGLMESICGCKASMLWKVSFPYFNLKMSRTDWLVLNALRRNPRIRLSDLAHEVKVSTRTLSRRIDRMIEGYTFFLHAAIDLKKLGGLACRLLLFCRDQAKKRAVDDAVLTKSDRIEWLYTIADQYSMYVLHRENTTEVDVMFAWVKSLEGVTEARMDIIEEQITVQEWLDEEIEQRLLESV